MNFRRAAECVYYIQIILIMRCRGKCLMATLDYFKVSRAVAMRKNIFALGSAVILKSIAELRTKDFC